MYYEEKLINGVLHYRTHPKDDWCAYVKPSPERVAAAALALCTLAERMRIFSEYCMHCGIRDPQCQCSNDE